MKETRQRRLFRLIKLLLLSAASLALGIYAGCFLYFPAAAVEKRLRYEIESRLPLSVEDGEISLGFPASFTGRARVCTLSPGLCVDLDEYRAAPVWTRILSTAPLVSLTAKALQGELSATYSSDGVLQANGQMMKVDLPFRNGSIRLHAQLSQASFSGAFPFYNKSASRFQILLDELNIAGGGFILPALNLKKVQIEATGSGNVFKLEKCSAEGGQLSLSCSGSVMLRADLPSSNLYLQANIIPGPELPSQVTDMLSMLAVGKVDGSYDLQLKGVLGQPLVTLR